ncbi:MAG: CRISPR-associated protein (Cas_Cas5) [Pelotomaculum sp. PtaU1.Bin035]|nr:MAG: CRISPR-associated protein (Cas_Cas5) [Pelotomaculum sp. PtaU1.Bin035]
MKGLNVVKISLQAPSAHYHVPFTNNPRNTYPLPPYSTIIGMLANIIGERALIERTLTQEFSIGVLSQFGTLEQYSTSDLSRQGALTQEYCWLRNMSREMHAQRFVEATNRRFQERPEHPGGQIPVVCDVLNNIRTFLYFSHSDQEVMQLVEKRLTQPEKWFSHLHLGRAEDWVIPYASEIIELLPSDQAESQQNARNFYQWLPAPESAFLGNYIDDDEYQDFFQRMNGSVTLVTSLFRLVEVPYSEDRKGTIRSFNHVKAKICRSQIPLDNRLKIPVLLTDQRLCSPVFMAKIEFNN